MSDNDEFRVPPDLTAQPFICPNCQSSNCSGLAFVDPAWTFGIGSPSDSPWDFVFQLRFCGECGATIPAHLAERWEGMTVTTFPFFLCHWRVQVLCRKIRISSFLS